MTQDTAFQTGESDAYWRRNADHIHALLPQHDIPLAVIRHYRLTPRTALEIGAANGYRLHWLRMATGADCLAVDPSAAALADGQTRYPSLRFRQATAANMDLNGEQFDLVIVNYVLHWVDRSELFRSVANIDGAVKDGGYLLLGDFYPGNRYANPYHHKPGLYTFKQDYARLFLESGLYHLVDMKSSGHGGHDVRADVPEQERYACWLLRKSLTDHYVKGV